MGYMWSDDLTLHVSTSTDMTGDGGSNISLLALYSLGKESKKPEPSPVKVIHKEPDSTPQEAKSAEPKSITPVVATSAATTATQATQATQAALAPLVLPSATMPTTITNIKKADKNIWLECTKVIVGWDKEIMKCQEISEEIAMQVKPVDINKELSQTSGWLSTKNQKHFTVDISSHPSTNQDAIAQDLQKSRISFKEPSFLHRTSKKRVAIAVGDFATRDEAFKFLNSLRFVTDKSAKNIRTFGGIANKSISTQ